MEEHHENVQSHGLLGELHVVVSHNLRTKSSKRIAKENGGKDQQDSDPDVQGHDGNEQPVLGLVGDPDELLAKVPAEVGGGAAGQRDDRNAKIVDLVVSALADAGLYVTAEEAGNFNRNDPVLEAKQPVDDDREEEEQEDCRRDGPGDDGGLLDMMVRLLEVVSK